MESNTIYLSFIQVEAMEVEQVGNELQQVFRRSFHVVEIEALPSVNGEPGEQVSISHNGTQGSLEIVGNGKHQLFAGGKQLFGKTIGFFQLTPITVTTGDIPPDHDKKDNGQHNSPSSNTRNNRCRTMPNSFLILSLFAGTHQGFLFISFQKTVDTSTQCMIKTLQSSLTTLHHTIGSPLLLGNSAQLRVQGINRIISIEYSIRSNFKGCLHLNS